MRGDDGDAGPEAVLASFPSFSPLAIVGTEHSCPCLPDSDSATQRWCAEVLPMKPSRY